MIYSDKWHCWFFLMIMAPAWSMMMMIPARLWYAEAQRWHSPMATAAMEDDQRQWLPAAHRSIMTTTMPTCSMQAMVWWWQQQWHLPAARWGATTTTMPVLLACLATTTSPSPSNADHAGKHVDECHDYHLSDDHNDDVRTWLVAVPL